jgi:hypothetical protein
MQENVGELLKKFPHAPSKLFKKIYWLYFLLHLLIHANFKVSMGPLPHLTANSIIHAHIK